MYPSIYISFPVILTTLRNIAIFTNPRNNLHRVRWCVTVVQGDSRSSKLVPTESPYATSYRSSIVTIRLSAIISEIKRFIQKSPFFLPILPTPVSLEAVARGFPCDLWKSLGYVPDADIGKWNPCDPVRICLRRIIGYRLVTKGQTDRRTDGRTNISRSRVALWHSWARPEIMDWEWITATSNTSFLVTKPNTVKNFVKFIHNFLSNPSCLQTDGQPGTENTLDRKGLQI